ncbi:MAG: methyl-accepting chemotaxis protein [Synergistaceae bacterium]|jgi:methyl-accepting chemotaxis protein|nr:methyl-accepting chemotaxis protein [Synergistaceae bacterium]
MKLICSFSAIVLFNICFGVYVIRSLAVMNGRSMEVNEWTGGISEMAHLEQAVAAVRRADLIYALETTPKRMAETMARRNDAMKRAESLMTTYRQGITALHYDSEEQKTQDLRAIDSILARWDDYKVASDKLLAAAGVGATRNSEALADAGKGSIQAFEAVEREVLTLSDYNLAGSNRAITFGNQIYRDIRAVIITLLVVVTIFSMLITYFLTQGIRRAFSNLLAVSQALGRGDLRVSAKVYVNDEFGTLAKSYNLTIENFKTLISGIQESAKHLTEATRELNANAVRTSDGTNTIVERIENVSTQSDTQRSEIKSMTQTMSGLSSDIDNATRLADTLAKLARESVSKAQKGSLSIEKAVEQMNMIEETVNSSAQVVGTLGERSVEIGRIVETISGISSQTNLLALNAAIEAARAGEQGRGFAVVADEVKSLAGESRAAAEEIANLISSIQEETAKAVASMNNGREKVRSGSMAVRESGQAFGELANASVQSFEQLQGVANTMHEMSSKTGKIVAIAATTERAGHDIADNSLSVAAAAQEQAAAVEEISSASGSLAHIAEEMLNFTRKFTT